MGSVGSVTKLGGLNTDIYFNRSMRSIPNTLSNRQHLATLGITDTTGAVDIFESEVNDQDLISAFKQYSYGVYGSSSDKHEFDLANGLSTFIDSNKSLHPNNNPTLYRGVVLSNSELENLKVGGLAPSDTFTGITSWSTREMVSHMYSMGDSDGNTMGGKTGNPVVFIDNTSTNDGIVLPYTYPQNEIVRSNSYTYQVTNIISKSNYKQPIGRNTDSSDYYNTPVTYVYVKRVKAK